MQAVAKSDEQGLDRGHVRSGQQQFRKIFSGCRVTGRGNLFLIIGLLRSSIIMSNIACQPAAAAWSTACFDLITTRR